jgi:hypothetical protein
MESLYDTQKQTNQGKINTRDRSKLLRQAHNSQTSESKNKRSSGSKTWYFANTQPSCDTFLVQTPVKNTCNTEQWVSIWLLSISRYASVYGLWFMVEGLGLRVRATLSKRICERYASMKVKLFISSWHVFECVRYEGDGVKGKRRRILQIAKHVIS